MNPTILDPFQGKNMRDCESVEGAALLSLLVANLKKF